MTANLQLARDEHLQYVGVVHPLVGLSELALFRQFHLVNKLVVTDRRCINRDRLHGRAVGEVELQSVESVQVEQGWVGRYFHVGTLRIQKAGGQLAVIRGVLWPHAFRRALLDAKKEGAKP